MPGGVGCGTQPTGEVKFRRNLRAYIPENSVFGGARSIPTAFGFLVSRRVNNHRDACAQISILHILLFYFVRVGSVHFYMRRTRNSSGWKRFGGSFFTRKTPENSNNEYGETVHRGALFRRVYYTSFSGSFSKKKTIHREEFPSR